MDVKLTGNKMTLTFDVDPKGPASQSGKSHIAFTTGGFTKDTNGYGISVNVLVPKK